VTDVEGIVEKLLYNSSLNLLVLDKNNIEKQGGDFMNLIPFGPFTEIERLRRDIDEIFNLTYFERPRVDVFEDEKEVRVVAEIPGISKDDIDITVFDDSIKISGEIKRSSEYKEEHVRRSERFYGKFTRTIPLPCEVKSEEAKADYKDGVLSISIPKKVESKNVGRKIKLS